MRIYGNRRLRTLPGKEVRPTSARVREAVFQIWQGRIAGSRWLDLCAGNGSMGAEALCRGARLAVAIDRSRRACAVIRENWQQVADKDREITILQGDAAKRLASVRHGQFDFIYFDPPYASNIYKPVIEAIATFNILARDGEIAVERDPQQTAIAPPASLVICREKVYGNTALTFLRVAATEVETSVI